MKDNVKKLIAVVEDDELVLDAIGLVLESNGWGVASFQNGESFLASLDGIRPDVLLLDPHLPGINGAEVLHLMRADARLDGVKVVIITAHSNGSEVEALRKAGVGQVLLKPITEQTLLDALQSQTIRP